MGCVDGDTMGDIYITDYTNNYVYLVSGGSLSHFAGTGGSGGGPSVDGTAITSAVYRYPQGIYGDSLGNIYI